MHRRSASTRSTIERATEYAAEDADVTLQLHQALYPQVSREDGLRRIYGEIEMPTRTCCTWSATAC